MNSQARERMREHISEYCVAAFQTPRVLEFQVATKLQDLPAERDALLAVLKSGRMDDIRRGTVELPALAKELVDK